MLHSCCSLLLYSAVRCVCVCACVLVAEYIHNECVWENQRFDCMCVLCLCVLSSSAAASWLTETRELQDKREEESPRLHTQYTLQQHAHTHTHTQFICYSAPCDSLSISVFVRSAVIVGKITRIRVHSEPVIDGPRFSHANINYKILFPAFVRYLCVIIFNKLEKANEIWRPLSHTSERAFPLALLNQTTTCSCLSFKCDELCWTPTQMDHLRIRTKCSEPASKRVATMCCQQWPWNKSALWDSFLCRRQEAFLGIFLGALTWKIIPSCLTWA